METVYSTSNFRWGHELTDGVQLIEPDPSDLVPYIGPDGEPVTQPDGTPIMVPPSDFQPDYEKIDLDTLVIVDNTQSENTSVFKFAIDNGGLARFLAYYVQFLDVEGRQTLRSTLTETSDIVPANVADIRHLELVKS